MPDLLWWLYRIRRFAFALVVMVLTGVAMVLSADVAQRFSGGALVLEHLRAFYGFGPTPEYGLKGVMGVYPASPFAHVMLAGFLLMMFLGSQVLFLGAGRGWFAGLVHRTRPGSWSVVVGGLPLAMLTVALLAMLFEPVDAWARLPGEVWDVSLFGAGRIPEIRFQFFPAFQLAICTFFVSWAAWAVLLRRCWMGGDRYFQFAGLLFRLFVAATVMYLVSTFGMAWHITSQGQPWLTGAHTAAALAATVLLWTLGPTLALGYAADRYRRERIELIHHGDLVGIRDFA